MKIEQNPIYHIGRRIQRQEIAANDAIAEIIRQCKTGHVTLHHVLGCHKYVNTIAGSGGEETIEQIERSLTLATLNCNAANVLKHEKLLGNCHKMLGGLYLRNHDLVLARTHYQQALLIFQSDPALCIIVVQIRLELGEIEEQLGNLDDALVHYDIVATIAPSLNRPDIESDAQTCLGNIYFAQGNVEDASLAFYESLHIIRTAKEAELEASTSQNVEQISYQNALMRNEAAALGNLGRVHYYLGDIEEAKRHHEQAIELCQEVGHRRGEGRQLGSLGSLLISLGKYDQAEEKLQEALTIAEEYNDSAHQYKQLARLGNLAQAKANQAKDVKRATIELTMAERRYLAAKDLAHEHKNARGKGEQLINIGRILFQQQLYKEACQCYQQALKLTIGIQSVQWRVRYALGNLYMIVGQIDDAFNDYQEAIQIVENQRYQLHIESRTQFWQEKSALYKAMVLCCLQLGMWWEALAYTELAKTRYLADMMQEGKSSDKKPLSVHDTIRTIKNTLNSLLPESAIIVFNVTRDETVIFVALPETPKSNKQELDNQWYVAGNLYVKRVQGFGDRGLKDLLIFTDDATNKIGGYLGDYYDPDIEWNDTLEDTIIVLSQKLLSHVWPLLNQISVQQIIFIPNLELSLLPLHACFQTEEVDNFRFIERFEVIYIPSFYMLGQCMDSGNKRIDKPSRLLAISDPTSNLIYGDLEVNLIKEHVVDAHVLENNPVHQPTSDFVFDSAYRYNLLHFSCHGYFNLSQVHDSFLQLFPENLTLNDLLRERLHLPNTWLVVMSACETGLVMPNDLADEYISFPAGILLAGVPTVISTLWGVDEYATALLMNRFYENLCDDLSIGESLVEAQMWLCNLSAASAVQLTENFCRVYQKKDKKIYSICEKMRQYLSKQATTAKPFAHPYYWAAFVITGKAA
ncbi:MAG: CHAT domain-containing protein [Chloroflexota bacterium]